MVRVKRGTTKTKKRERLLKHVKGFKWGRKSKFKAAKDALAHAWSYAYRDRKNKKRSFRAVWQTQINAACRKEDMSYSKFIHYLKENKIEIDRKILSQLAKDHPDIFKKIVEKTKEAA